MCIGKIAQENDIPLDKAYRTQSLLLRRILRGRKNRTRSLMMSWCLPNTSYIILLLHHEHSDLEDMLHTFLLQPY